MCAWRERAATACALGTHSDILKSIKVANLSYDPSDNVGCVCICKLYVYTAHSVIMHNQIA